MTNPPQMDLCLVFNNKASAPKHKNEPLSKSSDTVFVSFRVTLDEKAQLQKMAGALAVSNFIRQSLFGDDMAERSKKHVKKKRKPKLSHVEIARILGMLGKSELATSMLALSLAAQAGELAVSPDIEGKIETACDDISQMRDLLIFALGVKPQGHGK